jgi:hypothetical protein
MKSRLAISFFLASLLGMIIPAADALAQGNLLITPRRVVFEGNLKTQELNLANTGQEPATYSVSFIQYRMKEDGSFEEIKEPDPGQQFADPFVRIFPRSVILQPNEAQVVKLQLTKTDELKPGEYRSHVYFRAEPEPVPLGEENEILQDTSTISVRLTPIFGITIPVIIRMGESNTTMSLSDLSYTMVNDTLARLLITLNRAGNFSVYGDISVNYVSPQGVITPVGLVKGIAVYTPNARRIFEMDIIKPEGIDLSKGKLNVAFISRSDGKEEKLAVADLILQ